MANKRVLITSSGCYAVNDKGATVALDAGEDVLIEDVQAAVFIKAGKAELVINKKKAAKKISSQDDELDEGVQDDDPLDESLGEPEVKEV